MSALPAQAETQVFKDVPKSNQFYEHVNYLYENKIMSGLGDGTYGSEKLITRKQAAQMIAKALKLDTTPRDTQFKDVKKSDDGSGAIQSAVEAGIIKGYPEDNTFRAGDKITRAQMASFLARGFHLKEEAQPFLDVKVGSSAYSDIRKVTAAGIAKGYSPEEFGPQNFVTRIHFAGFLARALNDNLKVDAGSCGYDSSSKKNPSRQTVNCLLTTAALEAGVPPEVVKGIASVESNGWTHFQANGEPLISSDGGIGIMQITTTQGYDKEKLKYDMTYNIEKGIEMLANNFKRTDLPKVGDHNPENLESWYFAVMAYNGTKAVNSPVYQATGLRNTTAYQEKVYKKIEENGLRATNVDKLVMTKEDFTYGEETNYSIVFNKKSFALPTATPSTEVLKAGSRITYHGKGLREHPSTNSKLTSVSAAIKMTILGSPVYTQEGASSNHFVWYPVEASVNGKKVVGYIASSNISE